MARTPGEKKGLGQKERSSLHIVEFSKGKPNELSLNVLDNLASDTGEKKGFLSRLFGAERTGKHPSSQVIGSDVSAPDVSGLPASTPVKPKGSMGGLMRHRSGDASSEVPKHAIPSSPKKTGLLPKKAAAAPSRLIGHDSQQEIERRQRARRAYRLASVFLVVALSIGGIGAGGWYLYEQYQEQLQGIDLLKASVRNVEGADEAIVAVDGYFAKAFDKNTVSQADQLKKDMPEAELRLEAAKDMAQRAADGLDEGSQDKQVAEHAVSSITAREKLLAVAGQRLDEDVAAKTAYDKMEEAWAKLEEGNSLMVQAASLVSDTTNENVNQATEYLKEARTCFAESKKDLKAGFKAYPLAKETTEYDYLKLRQQAIGYALASNEAILIQDKKTAEKNNDKYNKLDKKASKLATSYSKGFFQVVVDAYSKDQESLQKDYESLRSEIGTHDSFIRDYLGDDSWV